MPSSVLRDRPRPSDAGAASILVAGGDAAARARLGDALALTGRRVVAAGPEDDVAAGGWDAALVLLDAQSCRLAARLRHGGSPVLALVDPSDATLRETARALGVAAILDADAAPRLIQARLRALWRDRAEDAEDAPTVPGFAEAPTPFHRPAGPRRAIALGDRAADAAAALSAALGAPVEQAATPVAMAPGEAPEIVALMVDPTSAEALGLLAELRLHPLTCDSGVLVMVDGRGDDLAALALDLGAGDVLPAPTPPDYLAEAVRTLLARRARAAAARARMQARLDAALVDPLTGLSNRRHAEPEMRRIAEQAARTRQGYAVMVIDIDHFKRVNDRHGHAAGDAVLVEVARRIRDAARPGDLVARIGGEEFVVVAPELDVDAAHRLAQGIRQAVAGRAVRVGMSNAAGSGSVAHAGDEDGGWPSTSEGWSLPGRAAGPGQTAFTRAAPSLPPAPVADLVRPLPLALPVAVSIGVALAPPGTRADRLTEIYAQADAALYAAKAGGRNLVAVAP